MTFKAEIARLDRRVEKVKATFSVVADLIDELDGRLRVLETSNANRAEQHLPAQEEPRYGCQEYPVASCANCGRCCASGDNWCPDWTPCRGGHPSTPNPCECSSQGEYDLYLGACAGCPHIQW